MVFTWDVEALLCFQLQMMNPLVRTNEPRMLFNNGH